MPVPLHVTNVSHPPADHDDPASVLALAVQESGWPWPGSATPTARCGRPRALLHAAGLGATASAGLVDYDSDSSVFRFDGVEVSGTNHGVTTWTPTSDAKDRFIFQITDLDHYQAAMTNTLGEPLRQRA